MPQPRKYTDEQRLEIKELWQLGREFYKAGEKQHGRYTLKDIEEITGVPRGTCWMIAKGLR